MLYNLNNTLYSGYMARQNWTTTSYSIRKQVHDRLKRVTRLGDRSRLVSCLIEMWLDGRIAIPAGLIRQTSQPHPGSISVAQHNINENWQQP